MVVPMPSLLLAVLVVLQLHATSTPVAAEGSNTSVEEVGAKKGAARAGRGFLAYLSTSTYTTVSFTTTQAFFTCVSAAATNACMGRKRRRRQTREFRDATEDDISPMVLDLTPSQQSVSGAGSGSGRWRRAPLLQVTTTVTASVTITSTSTNSATTVSVSLICTLPNNIIPNCG